MSMSEKSIISGVSTMSIILNRGSRTLLLAILGLALCSFFVRPAAAADVLTSMSDSHMEAILKSMDVEFSKTGDHKWRLTLDDSKVAFVLGNDGTDIQFYLGFGDAIVSAEAMNKWNAAKRFSRAYSDSDRNPILEWDVDFAGGVTDDTVKAAIRLFRNSVGKFKTFVRENKS
jgi:hypothetical protein